MTPAADAALFDLMQSFNGRLLIVDLPGKSDNGSGGHCAVSPAGEFSIGVEGVELSYPAHLFHELYFVTIRLTQNVSQQGRINTSTGPEPFIR